MDVTARQVARGRDSYNLRQLRALTQFSARGRDAGRSWILSSQPSVGSGAALPHSLDWRGTTLAHRFDHSMPTAIALSVLEGGSACSRFSVPIGSC
jgi:hypothetical protein